MYNYFYDNAYPYWMNRFMPQRDLEVPFDVMNQYMGGYNPMYMMNTPNFMPDPSYIAQPSYMKKPNPYKNLNKNILNLNNEIRRLWLEHVLWTKLTIMSIASGSADVQLVSQRLLKNADDFAKLLLTLYGPTASEKFKELFRQHLLIAADLVNAAKRKDNASVNLIDAKWHKNADAIADFLSSINPYWGKEEMRHMMREHLDLTKSEAIAILSNKYEDAISLFDQIENQALVMADTYVQGILKQFPNKF